MDVYLNTYEYTDWGQLVRFMAANSSEDVDAGARVPSIWAKQYLGRNTLHITSYIVNFDDPNGPGGGGGPNNYETDFSEDEAPAIKKWFTITISQRPKLVREALNKKR